MGSRAICQDRVRRAGERRLTIASLKPSLSAGAHVIKGVVTQAHCALEQPADRVFGVYTTAGEERAVLIKIQEAGMQRRLADLLQQR
jgi:hypothetical protein